MRRTVENEWFLSLIWLWTLLWPLVLLYRRKFIGQCCCKRVGLCAKFVVKNAFNCHYWVLPLLWSCTFSWQLSIVSNCGSNSKEGSAWANVVVKGWVYVQDLWQKCFLTASSGFYLYCSHEHFHDSCPAACLGTWTGCPRPGSSPGSTGTPVIYIIHYTGTPCTG